MEKVSSSRIFGTLMKQYDRKIMNKLHRSDYVECMIALTLGKRWCLSWEDGWEWAPWDCENVRTGARLEIKQSAAQQPWSRDSANSNIFPRFDIKPRTGYWPRDGSSWIDSLGRPADIYVFAWHDCQDRNVDHRNPEQWSFYVVPESKLPDKQQSIALSKIHAITKPCGVSQLRAIVQRKIRSLSMLKADCLK